MTKTHEWYVAKTNYNALEVFDTIKNEIICSIYGGKTIGEQYEIASRIANLPDIERQRDVAIAERDALFQAIRNLRDTNGHYYTQQAFESLMTILPPNQND